MPAMMKHGAEPGEREWPLCSGAFAGMQPHRSGYRGNAYNCLDPNPMRSSRLILSAVAAAGLFLSAGCANHKPHTTIVVKPLPDLTPDAPVRAQVAWIRLDPNTVIVRFDGYRHALSRVEPERAEGPVPLAGAAGDDRDSNRLTVSRLDAEQSHRQSEDAADGLPPFASTPEALAAWQTWCTDEPVTEEQYELTVSTRLPPDAVFSCDDFHKYIWRK